MVQIHPDPPIFRISSEAAGSRAGARYADAFERPAKNFDFMRRLRRLEIEIKLVRRHGRDRCPAKVSLTQDTWRPWLRGKESFSCGKAIERDEAVRRDFFLWQGAFYACAGSIQASM